MLADDPGLAAAWRLATREVFAHYLARGYRVVDFVRGAAGQGGAYVVSRAVPADLEA
jgi:predicted GNAT superfamily acetyltransferase